MQITKEKKTNAVNISVLDTNVLWLPEPVKSTEQIEKMSELTGLDMLLFTIPEDVRSIEEVRKWDVLSQQFKQKGIVLVFASGEYQVKSVHLKGSSLDSAVHYVLDTPEGTVGLFYSTPSDSFIKNYAPIDVIVGKDTALSTAHLDFEPFYVILTSMSEDYKKKSGVSEVQSSSKVNIKRVDPAAREGNVTTEVIALE